MQMCDKRNSNNNNNNNNNDNNNNNNNNNIIYWLNMVILYEKSIYREASQLWVTLYRALFAAVHAGTTYSYIAQSKG